MQLSNSQKHAVNQLIQKYHAWKFNQKEKTVDFSAPTGAGKTFIISNFVAELLRNKNPEEKIIVFLATLSSSKLPKQFAEKVKSKYMHHLPWKFDVDYKMAPSSKKTSAKDYQPHLIATDNTMIIVGRSSFTKSSIFIQQGCFEKFLAQIKNENYQLIYIRDEAHHGGSKESGKLNGFENKIQTAADFVIRMTATLKNHQNVVAITEDNVREDRIQLLKTKQISNHGVSRLKIKAMSKLELLDHCLEVFKNEIIPKYQKACQSIQKTIHPAFLIQVESEHKENSSEFQALMTDIKKRIRKFNLNYAIYFDRIKTSNLRENVNLLEISEHQSPIDVILFKIGPATGWDIPRACMLLQLRNVGSWTLMQQTSGRIKRNPVPENDDLPANSIFNQYYLYLNRQQGLQREFLNYELKKPAQKWTWIKGEITNANEVKIAKIEDYQSQMARFLDNAIENKTINNIEEIIKKEEILMKFEEFSNGKIIYSNKYLVRNALELLNQYNKKQRRYFYLIKPIQDLLAKTAKKIGKNYNFLIIFVCENIVEIKKIYDDCFFNQKIIYQHQLNDQAQAVPNYTLIESQNQPKPFILIDQEKTNYLYQVNLIDNQAKQLLDSKAEEVFMGYVGGFISYEPTIQKLVNWAKNPSRGQINFEYIDKNQTRSLFPDFVFKIGKYYLYIEVKSINDFSSAKTDQIKKVFKNYIDQNPNANIVLSVCYIDIYKPYNPIAKMNNYSRFSEISDQLPVQFILKALVKRCQKDLETC